ncbi:MAG: IS200/IS605 family transposase [Candidatus Zixiibacteriota bacterium]|nr:MAG: IS200/IS605 family transposase [candidate division Zixibacteria bacterium]
MSHSFVSMALHCVFSTKLRRPDLTTEIRQRLYPYIVSTAHQQRMQVLALGGVEDHLHALISLPATMSVAKAIQWLKGPSSRWVHETFPEFQRFAWQHGYSAFSIGVSQRERTIDYIRNQAQHHQNKTFEQELRAFYARHGFRWDASVLE